MVEFKLVISDPKSGKSYQKEVKDELANALVRKKIGDKISGDSIGFAGYEFEITGGSDYCGFPMRRDVAGIARKQITAVSGVGIKNRLRKPNPKKKGWRRIKGMRTKKTVAGNTIYTKTSQINLKVLTPGKAPLGEAPAEEKKEEKAEEKKEEPKPEKKEEVKEEKPKEEKKEEKPEPKKEEPPKEEKVEEVKEKKPEPKEEKDIVEKELEKAEKTEEKIEKEEKEMEKLGEEEKKIEKELEEAKKE